MCSKTSRNDRYQLHFSNNEFTDRAECKHALRNLYFDAVVCINATQFQIVLLQ